MLDSHSLEARGFGGGGGGGGVGEGFGGGSGGEEGRRKEAEEMDLKGWGAGEEKAVESERNCISMLKL